LALAVGILVDDSTVTIENTHRLLEQGDELMDRDRIDEATIRRLLRQAAVARAAPSPPQAERLLALVMGSPLLAGIRYAWDIAVRTLRQRRD
jgi:hypothetical protein